MARADYEDATTRARCQGRTDATAQDTRRMAIRCKTDDDHIHCDKKLKTLNAHMPLSPGNCSCDAGVSSVITPSPSKARNPYKKIKLITIILQKCLHRRN